MRKRISRKESQLQTRERLLDAALEVFSRRGYYAASVDEIAAEAGYSKGAVYSNFSNKEELFLALIDRRFAKEAQGYPRIINVMTDGFQMDEGSDFRSETMKDSTWNILMIEFFLYAKLGKEPMMPVSELPWSVFSLGIGLMLQFYIDPESLPKGAYERALQQLLK